MKTENLFLVAALMAALNLMPAGRVTAQTFTTLHSFTAVSDGDYPMAGLIANSSGNTLYGTAVRGSGISGTVFALNTDGTGFTTLHTFTGIAPYPYETNTDGAGPRAGLILSGNTLYGTAVSGGSGAAGTVFAVNTDGTGFTNLHSFTAIPPYPGPYVNSDGAGPNNLILSGNTLYGTAAQGGNSGNGTVFAVNIDGSGFTNLHSFTAAPTPYTNSDGRLPNAGLILSGNTLYGTASSGGSSGNGTVFALNTDGTGFTNLHNFTAVPGCFPCPPTNSDGVQPNAGLTLSGDTLYGTAQHGGGSGNGTVFALNTDGTGFTTLHSPGSGVGLIANSSGNTLYGTTVYDGSSGQGTVFALNTDGTGFTNLHSFTVTSGSYPGPYTNSDGINPRAGLILSGNTLYGTASQGGSSGGGTVFSLSFRPQLTITPSGTNVILSWPISYAGFSYAGYILQESANLGSPTGWFNSQAFPPVIVDGQVRLTTPMLGPQSFYRLEKR